MDVSEEGDPVTFPFIHPRKIWQRKQKHMDIKNEYSYIENNYVHAKL